MSSAFVLIAGSVARCAPPRTPMTMGRRRRFGKPSSQPSPEQRAKLEEIARGFGVQVERAEDVLDDEAKAGIKERRTFYSAAEKAVGVGTLEVFERTLIGSIVAMLAAFLSVGLAIGVTAFFKASGSDAPSALSSFVDAAEPSFTPIFVVFLVLSSTLGIYKQSQLNSGATAYDARRGGD